jgi:hypothetical protein
VANNTMIKIIRYFQSNENHLTSTEFKKFWESLNVEERKYYLSVDLETGLVAKD